MGPRTRLDDRARDEAVLDDRIGEDVLLLPDVRLEEPGVSESISSAVHCTRGTHAALEHGASGSACAHGRRQLGGRETAFAAMLAGASQLHSSKRRRSGSGGASTLRVATLASSHACPTRLGRPERPCRARRRRREMCVSALRRPSAACAGYTCCWKLALELTRAAPPSDTGSPTLGPARGLPKAKPRLVACSDCQKPVFQDALPQHKSALGAEQYTTHFAVQCAQIRSRQAVGKLANGSGNAPRKRAISSASRRPPGLD